MAKFMILAPTWLKAVGTTNAKMYVAGDVVEYEGEPGSTMAAVCPAARAAKANELAGRQHISREASIQRERRWRASLPKWAKEKLQLAEQAMDQPTQQDTVQ